MWRNMKKDKDFYKISVLMQVIFRLCRSDIVASDSVIVRSARSGIIFAPKRKEHEHIGSRSLCRYVNCVDSIYSRVARIRYVFASLKLDMI